MKIYMDNCAIQRPLDDKSNLRNRIEAEAVMGLLELLEQGNIELVSSEILLYELGNTPDFERINFGRKVLSLSNETIELTDAIAKRAGEFEQVGMKPLDALHLAAATESKIEYLCTCDDKFIKKALTLKNIKTKVILPTDLIKEIGL